MNTVPCAENVHLICNSCNIHYVSQNKNREYKFRIYFFLVRKNAKDAANKIWAVLSFFSLSFVPA